MDIEFQAYNSEIRRLAGGADKKENYLSRRKSDIGKNEIDADLPDLQDITETLEPVPPVGDKPLKTPEKIEEKIVTPRSEVIKKCFNYFKIFLIFIVWAFASFLIILHHELKNMTKYVTVMPEEKFNFSLNLSVNHPRVGISIKGPFVDDNIADLKDENRPILTSYIEQIDYDNSKEKSGEIVSDKWEVSTVPPETFHFESTTAVKEYHLFKLKKSSKINSKLIFQCSTNFNKSLTLMITVKKTPIDKEKGVLFGSFVLVFLYVMIIWEIIDRTVASLIASTLSLAILSYLDCRPPLKRIISWIDVETMLLLFGMMIMVAIISETGIFDYSAVLAYKVAKGNVWRLIMSLSFFAAILSSFLDNVTIMLLTTPVTIRLCELMGLDPIQVLMCMVVYSNLGAALTPVGDPPNVIITTNPYIHESNVNVANFFVHMFPATTLCMIQTYIYFRIALRKRSSLFLPEDDETLKLRKEILVWENMLQSISGFTQDEDIVRVTVKKKIEKLKEQLEKKKAGSAQPKSTFSVVIRSLTAEYQIKNKKLLVKSTIAFVFVVALFFLHSIPNFHHLSLGFTSLVGALLLIILAELDDIEAIVSRVEWSTLIFFAALFITMECLSIMGVIEIIGNFVRDMIMVVHPEYRLTFALVIIIWSSALASAFLDNIPVSTMMVKIVIALNKNEVLNLPLHPLVWALACGCCFGGNGTIIGASANVVAAGVAGQHGYRITWIKFFCFGFPIMIGNAVMSTIYLYVAHVQLHWH